MRRHFDEPPLLTTDEVAHLLHIDINTVRRWTNRGVLKAYRIGSRGDRRFRRADIDAFLAGQSSEVERQPKSPVS
ncbi:helix-turn-helix domain-containing protein [Chloroflexota bacterium]